MYWYVLQIQQVHAKRLCSYLNGFEDILAVSPMMEVWLKKEERIECRPLFSGYLFVLSNREQRDFDQFLFSLDEGKKGIVKELKTSGVQALRNEEIELLEKLLDKDFVLRLSYGAYIGGRSIPFKGPLVAFSENIKKVDFGRNRAILDLDVFDREIYCGFIVKK